MCVHFGLVVRVVFEPHLEVLQGYSHLYPWVASIVLGVPGGACDESRPTACKVCSSQPLSSFSNFRTFSLEVQL